MGFEGRLFVIFVDAFGVEEWKDQGMWRFPGGENGFLPIFSRRCSLTSMHSYPIGCMHFPQKKGLSRRCIWLFFGFIVEISLRSRYEYSRVACFFLGGNQPEGKTIQGWFQQRKGTLRMVGLMSNLSMFHVLGGKTSWNIMFHCFTCHDPTLLVDEFVWDLSTFLVVSSSGHPIASDMTVRFAGFRLLWFWNSRSPRSNRAFHKGIQRFQTTWAMRKGLLVV